MGLKKSSHKKKKEINVIQTKRQRILLPKLSSHFSSKDYPYVFLDQRLKSRFFK